MSRDPYHDVKSEVEHALSSARSLHSSYLRLSANTTNSSQLSNKASKTPSSRQRALQDEALSELRDSLGALQTDLEDLEFSVVAVEESGDRWGVEEEEVTRRREHLDAIKREVEEMKLSLPGSSAPVPASSDKRIPPKNPSTTSKYKDIDIDSKPPNRWNVGSELERGNRNGRSYANADGLDPDEEDRERDRRDNAEWEEQEQQMLMHRQDNTISLISGTLSTLAQQAGLIGQEVDEQTEILEDLGNRVDHSEGRLKRADRKIKAFIRENEESKSGWCIGILIVILVILLLLVIIT